MFAEAREAGADPKSVAIIEKARNRAIDNRPSAETISEQIDAFHPANAWMNTEFHYAFRFIHLLEEMREKMFVFSAPPICGVLSEAISRLLAEATRAYLYGLNRSAIALCRTLLDTALHDRIDSDELSRYQKGSQGKGELMCLIDLASQRNMFTERAHGQADQIRKLGNRVMHQGHREPSDTETWQALQTIRNILEELCR